MAKKKRKPKRSVKPHEMYEGSKPKNRFCPKCGRGVFMARHADRWTCGKCSYTEFISKEKKK